MVTDIVCQTGLSRHFVSVSAHRLDVPESVKYKVIILTRRCLIGTEPRYQSIS